MPEHPEIMAEVEEKLKAILFADENTEGQDVKSWSFSWKQFHNFDILLSISQKYGIIINVRNAL